MTHCEQCQSVARCWLLSVRERAVPLLAFVFVQWFMLWHISWCGSDSWLAVYFYGVSAVFLANYAVWWGRALVTFFRWRRGDFHD